MGALMRQKDWSITKLGSPANWPLQLRHLVATMLTNPSPMLICWGHEYLQFYNDAFRPILGSTKHPQALGIGADETYAEIWDTIKPLFEKVMAGPPVAFQDFRLMMDRHGYSEEVFFDFSYTPILDENARVQGILVICTETTEKVNSIKHLGESEERFRTMAEGSGILIAVGDESSKATYFSKAWVDLTGRPMSDLIDTGWMDLVHPDDRDRYVSIYLSAFEKKEPFTGEFRILNRKGEYRWLLANGSPRFRSDGSFAGYISSCVDITDLKIAEAHLKENKTLLEQLVADRTGQLERSNQDLLQFAHVASHDLKEPVRKIKTYANLLRDEVVAKLTEKENRYVHKILSAAERMTSMIDGVLTFSTTTSTEQPHELIDLNKLLVDIQNDLEILINQKSAQILVGDLPQIEGAGVLIYQLFYNLLNNSLKFSKKGVPPRISVTSILVTNNDKKMARITFNDNGIGFEQKYATRIFDTFARLNAKDHYDGTGLGLALCKKIVERLNGRIEAEGVLNEGATFIITLPLHQNGTIT